MNPKEKTKGISFISDLDGNLTEVIYDYFNVFGNPSTISSMREVFTSDGFLKFLDFLLKIQENGAEFNLEIEFFNSYDKKIPLNLAGSLIDEQIIFVGTLSSDLTYQEFFKDLIGILSEQISELRKYYNDNSFITSKQTNDETDWYEDLTCLNNELVNLQRDLSKKNVALKKSMVQQRKAKKQLESFVESIPDGILVIELDGNVFLINSKAKSLFNDLTGLNLIPSVNFNSLGDENILFSTIQNILKTQTEQKIVVEPIKEELWLEIHPKFINLDHKIEPYALIIEIRDISEFVKFERLRTQFTSIVSHELKNPLSSINLSVESYNMYKDQLTEKQKEDLWNIVAVNTNVLKDLIDDLLLYTKANLGKIELEFEKVNLTDIIDNVINQLNPKWKSKKINIHWSNDENYEIFADLKRIEQVFRILVDNAIKYSNENSAIYINIRESTKKIKTSELNGVIVEIIDQGMGIKEDELSKIFHKFYRSKTAKKQEGSGLGLSISKELVQSHGGAIFVKSKYGKGSTFSVVLPNNSQ
ncbi:MAG: hypothetical protein GF317_14375 [Candidatus Lokiarchaeota archaeon]|nr:hypothetical protein [Candidatus Lokiarchaeota archaeon]MBD3200792.1 hypothetical protein [Candidatus Lokiarchaeota archaeon]